MDTKSKNVDEKNEAYEEIVKDFKKIKILKIITIIIMLVMLSLSFISFKDIRYNRSFLGNRDPYNTYFIGGEIERLTKDVLKLSELYKTPEYIKDPKNLLSEEIDMKKQAISNKIESEYEAECSKAYGKNSEGLSEEKKAVLYKEIKEKYTYSDEEVKNLIIQEKLADYSINYNALNNYSNFKYIVYDKTNNIWLTNYDNGEDAIKSLKEESQYFAEYGISGGIQSKTIFIGGKALSTSELAELWYTFEQYESIPIDYMDEVNNYNNGYSFLKIKSDLDVYISVPKELVPGDSIYAAFDEYKEANKVLNSHIGIFIGTFIGAIISIFALKKFKYKLHYDDKIVEILKNMTIEVKVLGLFIIFVLHGVLFQYRYIYLSDKMGSYPNNITFNNIVVVAIAFILSYLIIKTLILNYKDRTLLKHSYSIRLYNNLKIAMKKGSFGRRILLIIATYVVICVIVSIGLMIVFRGAGALIALFFDIVVTAIVIFILVKEFAYLNRISVDARRISEGKINEDIVEQGSGALRDLAHSINNMKEGLRKSIENENKSERMKTELISNVSHDLKTPLTSIITYVDLLKRVEVQPEEAKGYVEILDKKSQRLKVLIEDLFEASKAASGSMQLNFEKIEVNALLIQTLGEAEKKIQEAQLDFKTNIPQEKIYINADGRKIWRVFENLVSNAVKYSLKGTRVYLDVKSDDEKVYIVFKNVSAYELNFDSSEIIERFKRGEESRHTEGSGLGLAIAKNIVELHGGTLQVSIDGDLFKVTVELGIIES